jgi:peptide/nickel transport system substrate-binding protein
MIAGEKKGGQMKKLIFASLVLVLMAGLVLTGCAQTKAPETTQATTKATTSAPPPTTAQPQYGGTFRLIIEAGPPSIGWPQGLSGPSDETTQVFCEGLLKGDAQGNYKPWLAESYEIAPDHSSITFKIRKGVKFHDGTDFNAQAAKWNLDWVLKPGPRMLPPMVKSIDLVDDYTIRVNVSPYTNTILYYLADYNYMVSPTAYEKNGQDWMMTHPVGTGPFIFESFQRDVRTVGVKNPNYWVKGLPYLDKIEILYVTDYMTRKAAMQAGEADATRTEFGKEAAEMKDIGLNVKTLCNAVIGFYPNSADPNSPFSKQKVREAVEYAVDREAIAKGLGYGMWQAPYQIAPRGSSTYDPNSVTSRKYNPEKAKQLLAEAGYPNGFQTKFFVSPITGVNRDATTAIQADLGKAGIKVDVEYPEFSKFVTVMNGGTWEGLMIQPIAAYANFNQMIGTLLGEYKTFTMWDASVARTPELLAALKASRESLQQDINLTRQIVKVIYDQSILIPLYEGGKSYAFKNNVHGGDFLEHSAPQYWSTENIWLSK